MEESKEFDILDVMVLIAENLRLLIAAPLLVSAIAWGIAAALPQSYVSQATVSPGSIDPSHVVAFVRSPQARAEVARSLGLSAGMAFKDDDFGAAGRIKAWVDKDKLVYLEVTASAPADAQHLLELSIRNWLKSTVPSGFDREILQRKQVFLKAAIESSQEAMRKAAPSSSSAQSSKVTERVSTVDVDYYARLVSELIDVDRALAGASPSVVKQQPTLPAEPVSLQKRRVALFVWLATAFFVVLFILLRQAWRRGSVDPQILEKQARLRAALRFGRK